MEMPTPEPIAEPKKSNRNLIIGIVVVLVLCCCCLVFLGLAWQFGDQVVKMLGM